MPRSLKSKIFSSGSLSKKLSSIRRQGKKIVFTNGCFDILHRGHVDYLLRARRLGDTLVVAVNSDRSVRQLKGPTRPVNKLASRLEVIAALESVDFVTWFSDQTPLKTIRLLRPDILVKGGDWKVTSMVGAEDVLKWGGTVKSLKSVPGESTTSILKRASRK